MPEAPKTRNLPDDPAHGLRTPPQSIQSEQAVLGGLLIDNTALDSVADLITAEDFCRRDHQIIYEHIVSLIQHGKPADIVTVGESIKNSGAQTALADGQYLQSLFSNTPSAANIRRYAEIVRDRAMLRQMIQVGEGMVTNALNPQGRDPEELLDEAEREVLAINERNARGRQGFRSLSTLVREVSERIIELYQNKDNSEVTGVATGFPNLDRVTAGFQRGDLIILAARPSMGKTALALNIAETLIRSGDMVVATGYQGLQSMLALQDPPTAIFCTNYDIALGAITAARDTGLHPPEGIAIFGYDCEEIFSMMTPSLPVVMQPEEEIGALAGQYLLERLSGFSGPPRCTRLANKIIY